MTTGAGDCPVCGSTVRPVIDLGMAPVGSCVLLSDATTARTYPTARLRLDACDVCGFVGNGCFDESAVRYADGYEESQAYSPTFLAYSDWLIEELDRRHRLQGRIVLEPGCGKGEFLVRLCEHTGAIGVGLDPAHVPGRIDTDAQVEFHQVVFNAATGIDADLVVCRHTLEHIGNVMPFMSALVTAARSTPGSVVIEVPDAQRIFDEGAFWDVYYEHASYFTATSLTAAAAIAGLRVDHLDRTFADQYLVLDASPDASVEGTFAPAGPDFTSVIDRFAETAASAVERWRGIVEAADRPVLWGASSKAVGFLTGTGIENVTHAVDINPHKHGSYLAGSGVHIVAPDDLRRIDPDLVVVMNPHYIDEITNAVEAMGLSSPVSALR